MIKQKLVEASRVNLPTLPDEKRETKAKNTALGIWWVVIATGFAVIGCIVIVKGSLYGLVPIALGFVGGLFGSNMISQEMIVATKKTTNTVARVADSAGGVIRRK